MDLSKYTADELARHALTDPMATERERRLAEAVEAAPEQDEFQEATERRDELEKENQEMAERIEALEEERDDWKTDAEDYKARLAQYEEA